MKPKVFLSWMALGCAVVLLNGCYTVLKAPFASGDLKEEPRMSKAQKAQERDWRNGDDPRIGRFARDGEDRGDGMGYGYGYPVFGMGYDSQYGMYGMGMPYGMGYGYGSPGYGYGGYGPYGYGYDPYYQGGGGTYIPPGYQLVTTEELEQLKANSRALADESVPQTGPSAEELKRAEAKKQRDVWKLRTDPQSRPAPVATPRPVAAPAGDTGGGSAPKTSAPPPQSTAPKKTRR